MQDKDINSLVEDTLSSADRMTGSVADELVFERILKRINQKDDHFIKDNAFGKYAIAFAILILINLFSFFNFHKNTVDKKAGDSGSYTKSVNEFAKEYFSNQTEYNYSSN